MDYNSFKKALIASSNEEVTLKLIGKVLLRIRDKSDDEVDYKAVVGEIAEYMNLYDIYKGDLHA